MGVYTFVALTSAIFGAGMVAAHENPMIQVGLFILASFIAIAKGEFDE